ncbi:MAG: YjbQ family protein [Starkeya sp.]|nr:YjbQ family protein [Starkeya sp.]
MARIRQGEVRESAVTRRFTTLLTVDTPGRGFVEITAPVAAFLRDIGAGEGEVSVFCRHTSASLTLQENADPDVKTDLLTALERLAPEHAGWVHDLEGPDDMPAHIKSALTTVSIGVPISDGRLVLGTWQGIYLFEHREQPHRREIVLHISA